MCQLTRLLQRVSDIHSSKPPSAFIKLKKNEKIRQSSVTKKKDVVPKGSLPVYVGKDTLMRFVIDARVLNHPLFAEILEASVEEFGYEYEGAIRIPCDVFLFEGILKLINSRRPLTASVCHE